MTYYYQFDKIFLSMTTKMSRSEDPNPDESVINWPPRPGSVIQDYGSKDPESEEIITDPQHCLHIVQCYGSGIQVFFDP
jgi:hypothetical protein